MVLDNLKKEMGGMAHGLEILERRAVCKEMTMAGSSVAARHWFRRAARDLFPLRTAVCSRSRTVRCPGSARMRYGDCWFDRKGGGGVPLIISPGFC